MQTIAKRLLAANLTALALVLPLTLAGINIALGVATAALVGYILSGWPWPWRSAWTPVAWCLVLYCAVSVLTSYAGVAPAISLRSLHKDVHKLWIVILLLPALRAARPRHLPIALAASFAFLAAYGIFQSCLDSYRSYQGVAFFGYKYAWVRAHAFTHPVTFGEMLALGLLGCLSFFGCRHGAPGSRGARIVLAGLLIAGLILNQTRGAFLGLLAGIAVLCWVEPAFRRRLGWGLAAAALCAIAMELLPSQRSILASLRDFGTAPEANMQLHRLILWDVAWNIFKDHPWLGVGPANYATVFTQYFQGVMEGNRVWSSAHNIFLQQLAERGLAGLTTLLALFWLLLAQAWRRARLAPDAWGLWALSATVCFLVMNLTESAFQNEQITTLFLFIWACGQSQPEGQP